MSNIDAMQNEIIEGNRIIAEFDGWKYIEDGDSFHKPPNLLFSHELKYHSSWAWLMPVVEKIENLNNKNSLLFYVSISGDECEIRRNDFPPHDTLITIKSVHKDKLKSTWLAVVEFIKWYNNLKQTV
jgi:hypothetical protein